MNDYVDTDAPLFTLADIGYEVSRKVTDAEARAVLQGIEYFFGDELSVIKVCWTVETYLELVEQGVLDIRQAAENGVSDKDAFTVLKSLHAWPMHQYSLDQAAATIETFLERYQTSSGVRRRRPTPTTHPASVKLAKVDGSAFA